jgi:hypothetical protein
VLQAIIFQHVRVTNKLNDSQFKTKSRLSWSFTIAWTRRAAFRNEMSKFAVSSSFDRELGSNHSDVARRPRVLR